jgi:hypothetical protein
MYNFKILRLVALNHLLVKEDGIHFMVLVFEVLFASSAQCAVSPR